MRYPFALLLLLLVGSERPATAQDEAFARIQRFITQARAKEVLTWLYPVPLEYRGIECPSSERIQNDGIVYHCRIFWTNILGSKDATAIAIIFDRNGSFQRTALEERSFAFTLSTQVIRRLAKILVDEYQEKLTPQQLETVRSAVESADAHTLMDLTLRFEQ